MYLPWNAPVEALGRTFAFRWLESTREVIVPIIEGERAGNGSGDRNGDNESGDRDGMVSSSNVDSMRVGGVQLAGEAGQHERPNAENKRNVPMSSRPPIQHPNHPYRNVRHRHLCGRIKSKPVKVNPAWEVAWRSTDQGVHTAASKSNLQSSRLSVSTTNQCKKSK